MSSFRDTARVPDSLRSQSTTFSHRDCRRSISKVSIFMAGGSAVVRSGVCAIYYQHRRASTAGLMPASSRKLLKQISGRVRSERTRLGLSQQEVAERADVSRRMLAAIEGEESNVSLATLDRIAAAL